jgi:hypothetical protein
MAACTCILNIDSLTNLCEGCEADYLKYCREIDTKETHEPEPDGSTPATLAELTALEEFTLEQLAGTVDSMTGLAAEIDALKQRIDTLTRIAFLTLSQAGAA